jgi:transposase
MMGHVTGQSRHQSTLFAEVLDEVVSIDDPVRVIDAFVETLDLTALGFSKVVAEEMGRRPYAPGDLLKLYIYGYLHRVRSSRRLEAETQRNVQVMWLINRLTPAFKTIADFRKDHAQAIVGVCRAFIRFCREQSLFGAELLAIDGTKIAAVASRKQVMTPQRIEKMNAAIDRKIAEYLNGDGCKLIGRSRERPVRQPMWRQRLKPSRHNKSSCRARRRSWRGAGSSSWL